MREINIIIILIYPYNKKSSCLRLTRNNPERGTANKLYIRGALFLVKLMLLI